ncbi:hypothetical protein PLICRDRAFT_179819 [Plicaturopsis crispa FD-325 SS-3]|uniref:RING-type domain-containing protein n=1 Tax=Plicaturopsis crispa FD-325 SS-3 TaxID=944288 RepID=A0A0C9T4B1_PLICR|nr:hypothetical protein PLICRDRAFT_179819 [Plicaturopsis crispa FD-325 SS-3]
MRSSTSHHRESLRCRASHLFNNARHTANYRPVLNVKRLIARLNNSVDDEPEPEPSEGKGKKRAAPKQKGRPRKRAKKAPSPTPSVSGDEDAEDSYPFLYGWHDDHFGHAVATSSVPVYRHVMDIEYTTNFAQVDEWDHFANDAKAKKIGWAREEETLKDLVKTLCGDAIEPRCVDLGPVYFQTSESRIVALSEPYAKGPGEHEGDRDKWFFVVPKVPWDDGTDLEASDYTPFSTQEDILHALYALEHDAGTVTCDTRLRLLALPSAMYDESQREMPFRLQLEITASFVLPAIFQPAQSRSPAFHGMVQDAQRRFLNYLFPQENFVEATIDIPFFYSILRSAPQLPSAIVENAIQPAALRPKLLPFQRRSVAWLLAHEGKGIDAAGEVSDLKHDTAAVLPPFWDKVKVNDGTSWYVNRLTGAVSQTAPDPAPVRGTILAEEPGLGKTLECIALILLNPHPARNPSVFAWDAKAQIDVKEIKTTLIVTPPSLAPQWADEFALHAPSLKVLIYDGWSKLQVPITKQDAIVLRNSRRKPAAAKAAPAKSKRRRVKDKEPEPAPEDAMDIHDADLPMDWCAYVNTFDVCITTYPVLQHDLSVARPLPTRPRRDGATYSKLSRPRSPLIMCEWARVIMDEVQMQGGGKTEEMVGLIPRLSSLAVSGTPARAQISDLIHVLKFLRVDGIVGSPRMWSRLLKPGLARQFTQFFRHYAVRTTKAAVKQELTIPQQTRYLVPIQLGKVERHVYDQTLEAALLELGLDARGVAASEGWQVDTMLLRASIRKLRGICTHPQVGQLQQKDKLWKPGALKTMADVLESMKDQNWRNLMDDRKLKVQSLIRRAQLQQHHNADRTRHRRALDTLLQAEKETNELIKEVTAALGEHELKGEALKKETAARREALKGRDKDALADKGKGKARERSSSATPSDDDESEDGDVPKTPAGEAYTNKRRALQQRVRESRVLLHRVKFLQGDVCHVLGAPEEDAAYAAAEEIRRDLLKTTAQSASRAMTDLSQDAAAKGLTEDALLIETPYCDQGGIRSSDLMDEANEIIEDLLNEQSKLLWKWRSKIHALLTQNLSSGENDAADGQEYARSLETQGEAETYLQAYTALLADRREALVAERTLLAAHDGKEKKTRKTKAALEAAQSAAEQLDLPEGVDIQPEHEVLHKALSDERKELIEPFEGRALKSVMIDLSAIAAKIANDKDTEKILIRQSVAELRQLINAQGSLMDKLDADLAKFRKAFNERILYFRQLQEISDSVSEVTWETTVTEAIQMCTAEEDELAAKINTNKARQRYLENLARHQTEEGEVDEDDECCILCRCDFVRGFITECAHVFCESCMKAWLLRKEGKSCPVCRVIINPDQLQRFSVQEKTGDSNNSLPAKPINGEPAPKSRREIQYNLIDDTLFEDIENVETHGSYGSKIQTLVRHLLYLKLSEPGSKSIVFSAWADSLHIVEHALTHNGISCLRIDQTKGKEKNAGKKFRTDPSIDVLLLHGERENAGLNVTSASRVFLLESVVHHGFEIQAIARIDRMGQTRQTEVFCYYAEDTVERNILDLAAKKGLSLYTKDNSAGTLNLTSLAADASKTPQSPSKDKKGKVQKGDFVFNTDDLLAILFPFLYEDIEYLIPDQDQDTINEPASLLHSTRGRGGSNANAQAGPSRLS